MKKFKFLYFIPVLFLCLFRQAFAQAPPTAADSALLKQITQQMIDDSIKAAASAPAPSPFSATRAPASANPDISVIGDFQLSYTSNAKRNFDAYLNEAEFGFSSVVDPYIRADFIATIDKNFQTGGYDAGLEEAYLTSLSLPARLQLKAGLFKNALGRINTIHSHAWATIDLPTAFQNYFAGQLADEGLSLSWLVPNNAFYQELIFQATAGPTDDPTFHRDDNGNHYLYTAHLKNSWNVTDNATLEFGLSALTGPNDSMMITNVGAFDLTYKYKPVQFNTYHSITWQTEGFISNAQINSESTVNSFGFYSLLTIQIAERWFMTGRYDYSNLPTSATATEQCGSLTLSWNATEFQKIDVEYKYNSTNYEGNFSQAWLRWIFVIGAHGAHLY